MSHEIRTPLTAILGYTDLLLEDVAAESAACEALRTVKRNGDRLLAIFNNIMDFSKIEAGQVTVEMSRCSPAQLIAEVQSLLQVRADAKGLTLRAECLGPVPAVIETDPAHLRQILLNLVGNAIKFTETGGVRLLAQFVDGEKPTMHFDVVDTGIGITGEQRARLFHPFTHGGASPRMRFEGTGLGLTISKRLAEMLGGDVIVVESMAGMGTRCRVAIPVGPRGEASPAPKTQVEAAQPESTQPEPALIKLSGRVLVAEDGLDNQRLIKEILSRAGVDVVVVENGVEACEAAWTAQTAGKPFSLILMDMQMPVMDGYEACRALREKGYEGSIIALTANALAMDREKCLDAGCDDYVSKPVDRGHLLAAVACCLEFAEVSPALAS